MKLSSANSDWKIKYMVAYYNQGNVITNSKALSPIHPLEFWFNGISRVDGQPR